MFEIFAGFAKGGLVQQTTPQQTAATQDALDETAFINQTADPVFQEEQAHLTQTYQTLQDLAEGIHRKMEKTRQDAAATKKSMSDDLTMNRADWDDAMEMYAEIEAMNRIVDGYNIAQAADAENLSKINLLLKQPYFAKVVLQFKPNEEPKELYIGNAGVSDEDYKRLVVDWRSPVAETYYNQDNGRTSYTAEGRVITCDLLLRRQFDIQEDRLNSYFDTTVAIQDSLLLAQLSKRRTAQMKAITATIQKEQNLVVRHEDVPALLVNGIAGSGKTSVLLQRIAYLFYQNRTKLDPSEVYLITPNPVFRSYIDNVLPDMGEKNPETITLSEFMKSLLPEGMGLGSGDVPLENLTRIDAAVKHFELEEDDFKDLSCAGKRLVAAAQIAKMNRKFGRIPAGSHRITLIREELMKRLNSRIKQMAATDGVQDELTTLPVSEQMRIFHETIEPQTEEETRQLAIRFLNDRYADAFRMVENDEWLRIERIGMRILGASGFAPVEWLYLKMALTGMSNPYAKYVMIDEVQDYTVAQLAVLARYFRRAHFLLLGDQNQAIAPGTATFAQIKEVFAKACGSVEECQLMTSYRSSPEITALFARLAEDDQRMQITSVQREDAAPDIRECASQEAYEAALREAVEAARAADGLTAVVLPWKQMAKRLRAILEDAAPTLLTENDTLPSSGVIMLPLKLAKGLEFDHVIIPDATEQVFGEDGLSRRRLYTTISRATHSITLLAQGAITPLLK